MGRHNFHKWFSFRSAPTSTPILNIAVKAARAAGSNINRAALDLEVVRVGTKGPNDYVSKVDQAAEIAIIDVLLEAYPGHGILAEESGRARGAKDSEYTWIIDPLDGTINFLHGFPVYAVSIALAHRGVVQQAVVYDPTRNDLFFASRGRGAFLNDRRLRVSKRTRISDSLFGAGFPFRKGDNFTRYVRMFEEVMPSCAGLRRPGAAALDLCCAAAGYYDGFFEVAGNPKVYGQLVQILAPCTRVIKQCDAEAQAYAEATPAAVGHDAGPVQALAQAVAAPARKAPVRIH